MLTHLNGYKREAVLAPLFKMLEATFDLFVPLVMADIVNVGITAHDFHYILVRCGILLLLAVVGLACSLTAQYFSAKAAVGYSTSLRHALFEHIQRLGFTEMDTMGTSTLITRMTSDINQVQSGLNLFLRLFLRSPFVVVGAMIMAFTVNVRAAWIFVVAIPLLSVVVFGVMVITNPLYKTAQARLDRVLGLTRENLTGVRVVRAFGRERFETDRFCEKNEKFASLWIRLGRLLSVYWASGTLLTCLQVMVIIVCGIVESVHGNMTLGEFLAFISYNEALSWPVRSLGRVLSDMSKAGVSLDRVGYILRAPEEKDAPEAAPHSAAGDIVFDHVTFGYGETPVLQDVSFTIPQGSTFAILGGTGSGKSTLVHLLDRLYDLQEGRITIGGVDIRSFTRESLRSQIGLVLQEPFLFSQTIRENIAATRPGAPQEELRSAAAIACVDEAITEFPEGYGTLVGERGVTLSGGQKQRVAIARMLLGRTPVMVFDDSLSAVDSETDAKIRAALREGTAGATVILISHRITTLMQADRILVLENGRVSDIGTHEELISRPGIYREIYDIQMSSDDRRLIEEGGAEDAGL